MAVTLPVHPTLEIRDTAGAVRHVALTAASYRLGRHVDNEVVIDSPIVSRLHLVLERDGAGRGGYVVRDTSTNGTWANGQRITTLDLTGPTELRLGAPGAQQIVLIYHPALAPQKAQAGVPMLKLVGRDTLVVGRDEACDLVLADPVCSRRHALLERSQDGSWSIRDLQTTNGTYVDGVLIQHAALQPGATLQLGNTTLLFDGSSLQSPPWARPGAGLRLDASGLVREGDGGQRLLDAVSFSVLPGEFVAVLGGSGAGKSTLLGALNGVRPPSAGELLFNGLNFYGHRAAFRNAIGYVPQDDIIHRELSVQRALLYAARLRMPSDTRPGELQERVQAVAEDVGLSNRLNLSIARLSGGQRKRVSIAVELLTRPPLLLLDEPTSGLDPGLDRQMMQLVDELAAGGQTVVMVTHAVGNVDLCDRVLFLSPGGRVAFFGSPAEARLFFGTDDFAEMYRTIDAERDPSHWRNRFEASEYYARNVVAVRAELTAPSPNGPPRSLAAEPPAAPARQAQRDLLVLAQRYLEIVTRDRGNLAFLLGQAPAVAIMLWLVSNSRALVDPTLWLDGQRLLFLMACAAAWFGTINSVREIVKEAPIFQREHRVGIGTGPYLASKVLVLTLLAMVQSILLQGLVGLHFDLPTSGVILPGGLEMYLTLVLTSVVGMALGLALSALSSSPDRATSLTPLLLIPQVVFAGVVFKLDGAAGAIGWLTATRPAVQALAATARLGFDPQGQPLDATTFEAPFVLARWLVLLTLAAVGFAATAVTLRFATR
jgi:ABC-type multidrug transport system ATPase subunit/pSer/pThr/pTyr-binding forkhead associated (FHA) protein